jgi:autotransporter-associated beta strand protein
MEWINANVTTNTSANTATIGGRIRMRADGGATGINFTVDDGAAATDLLVSAAVTEASAGLGITKDGAGTMVLSGTNTYTGNTVVNGGSLQLTSTSQMQFVVTEAPASNQITGTGAVTFDGVFNINTAAVTGTTGYIWQLVDRTNLSGESFGSNFSVTGFTQQGDGVTWTMIDSRGTWSFSEEFGELTLNIGSDYDTWATANGVTGGENDDDDSDGLTNHEEYAFGLDPTGGASANPIAAQLNKTTGIFSYTRRTQSLTSLTYSVWYSTNLATWTEDTGAAQGTPSGSGEVETVPVTLTGALLANPKLFIQVRAE